MPREEFDKALNELQLTIETVQGLVEKMIVDSIKALEKRDLDLANKVIEMDDEVDKFHEVVIKNRTSVTNFLEVGKGKSGK